jgi:hypothetical protein
MSRHVVLLRRDPSLGLALRALLHGTGRVTELGDLQAWSTVSADTVDAVVIDLPPARRRQAVDLVRSRFGGRLVVVLDPVDDPAAVPTHHACSVVKRPFEIVELWQLVTTDPTPVSTGKGRDTPPVGQEPAAAPAEPDLAPPPTRDDPTAPEAPGQARPPAADASTWKWRGRRYGPATALPTDPLGDDPGTGGATGPAAAPKPQPRTGDPARARGALPRRSADPRPGGPHPAQEPGRPGPGSGAADPPGGPVTDPGATGAADPQKAPPVSGASAGRPAARPGQPPAADPAPGPAVAPSGGGRPDPRPAPPPTGRPTPGQPTTPTAAPPGGFGPERPSIFRRLADRLGGHKSEVEVPEEQAPTGIRSAAILRTGPSPTRGSSAAQPASGLANPGSPVPAGAVGDRVAAPDAPPRPSFRTPANPTPSGAGLLPTRETASPCPTGCRASSRADGRRRPGAGPRLGTFGDRGRRRLPGRPVVTGPDPWARPAGPAAATHPAVSTQSRATGPPRYAARPGRSSEPPAGSLASHRSRRSPTREARPSGTPGAPA